METIENIQNFCTVVYSLRYLIAVPFVALGALALWGWWKGITV